FQINENEWENRCKLTPISPCRRRRVGMPFFCDVVRRWLDAANRQDADALLALSDPDIEVVGPRGSARGHQALREWLARAGLAVETRRAFSRGDVVVLAQHGVWRSPASGEVVGAADMASSFWLGGGRVVRYARYDDLAVALKQAGLELSDEVL